MDEYADHVIFGKRCSKCKQYFGNELSGLCSFCNFMKAAQEKIKKMKIDIAKER